MEAKRDEILAICQEAMKLLQEQPYTQLDVIGMMSHLGTSIGESTFSGLLKNGKGGPKLLASVSSSLQQLVRNELGLEWVDGTFIKTAGEGFISTKTPTKNIGTGKKGNVKFEEERLKVEEKVAFFKDAQKEVIEFGTTLSKFSTNLYSNSKGEFRSHVEELLRRDVKFRCFLVDPAREGLFHYFGDRANTHPVEGEYASKISLATASLKTIHKNLAEAGFGGNLEVFSYSHFPYGYFMAVDPAEKHGKMIVSPYLYGITRADSPTFIIYRKENPRLFNTYWDSLRALMKNAKRIIPA